jgi:hypothetical protein
MSTGAATRARPATWTNAGTGQPDPSHGQRRTLIGFVVLGSVLRVWGAFSHGLTFDETFTAMAGRRSPGDLLWYLRHFDAHPPLDYLLRSPLAQAGVPDVVLRAPSLLFSCAALALFAWWMRDRGRVGVVATALFALSTFQVHYGSEARMYALLLLLGVAAAIVAERWLRAPQRWHAFAIGGLLAVALFDHASAAVFGIGMMTLPGLRGDRAAWQWRAGVAGAGATWLVLWGPALLDQQQGDWASWIPRTTVSRFLDGVVRHLTWEPVTWAVLALVVIGVVALLRRDRPLGRLWLLGAALPFAIAGVVGVAVSFYFDKTLSMSSWAVPLACAAALDLVIERMRVLGLALVAVALVVTAAGTVSFLANSDWDYDLSTERLEAVVGPGDVIAVQPARYADLVEWRIGVRGELPSVPVTVRGLRDSAALRLEPTAGEARPARIWLLRFTGFDSRVGGFGRCAPTWTDGVTDIVCLTPRR